MSINLIEMVKGAIGDQILKQIGGIAGESEDKTRVGLNNAIPAIIGGLIKKVSTPGGADELTRSLDDYDGSGLDNLADRLSGDPQSGILESGRGILEMLFGASQSGIIGTIAKLAGISIASAGSLLGVLAPIVMGVLGRQRKQQGLDVGGLTNMLMSQKSHLADDMPPELSNQLGIGNLVSGEVKSVNPMGNAPAARDVTTGSGGIAKLLLPLIILAGLGLLAYNFLFKGAETNMPMDDEIGLSVPDVSIPSVPELTIPGLPEGMSDVPGKLSKMLGDLTSTVSGISDEASAQAAVGTIKDASNELSGMGLDRLPDAAKNSVSSALRPLVEKFKSALESAYAIPGVRSVLEPAVTPILGMIEGLSV